MMVRQRILFGILLVLLASCSGTPRYATPTVAALPTSPRPRIVENAGEVCFYTYATETGTLEGKFYPKGCYSSSCTRILKQSATATVNEQADEIRIESRFILLDTTIYFPEPQTCNADCNGGGEVSLVLENLKGDSYKVVLGTATLGVIHVGEVNSQGLCFGHKSD